MLNKDPDQAVYYRVSKGIMKEFRDIHDFKKIIAKIEKFLRNAQERKFKRLRNIVRTTKDYRSLRTVQGQTEEEHLFAKLERVVHRQEQYVQYVESLILDLNARIRKSQFGGYHPHAEAKNDKFGILQNSESKFIRAMSPALDDFIESFRHIRTCLAKERKFIKRWSSGFAWGIFSFWRPHEVMKNYNNALDTLFKEYFLLDAYIKVRKDRLPTYFEPIRVAMKELRTSDREFWKEAERKMAERKRIQMGPTKWSPSTHSSSGFVPEDSGSILEGAMKDIGNCMNAMTAGRAIGGSFGAAIAGSVWSAYRLNRH